VARHPDGVLMEIESDQEGTCRMTTIIGNIGAVLNLKGSHVWTVTPETIVFDAIELMAEKNVGALLVLDNGQLVGMLSERDYTRKVALKGKASKQTLVGEIMFSPVISVTPEDTVEECLRIMTENRVRHLPVVDGSALIGIVSIGDLVNWTISAQTATINHLESYIAGQYPG
jgi:CBS domain-containing protein